MAGIEAYLISDGLFFYFFGLGDYFTDWEDEWEDDEED